MTDNEQKKIFSNNLSRLLEKKGRSQREVAESIEVSPQTFNTWYRGIALPRMGKVQLLADYFGVGKSDLLDKPADSPKSHRRGVAINVLGRVAAGIPIEAVEDIIDTEEIPEEMARDGEYFGLQIHGDSMMPRICDGDVVIVKKQDDADEDDVVIVLVNGDDATCKRLKKYEKSIALVSNNPAYAPMVFTDDEIRSKPVRIIGKVIELRGKSL